MEFVLVKKYILIAGVNGAGKSTLYQTLHSLHEMIRVDSVEIAKKRVRYRVEHGGHGIPERMIEKRYSESLQNLQKVLPLCDLALMYDNTESFRRFAIYRRGTAARVSHIVPLWYVKLIEEEKKIRVTEL